MHPDPDCLFLRQFGEPIMRCLVVADLHYSLPQFDWLLSAAPQFDLVIFAGDALDIGSIVVSSFVRAIMTSTNAALRAKRYRVGSARSANSASPATATA
jgi:hypothetical protein